MRKTMKINSALIAATGIALLLSACGPQLPDTQSAAVDGEVAAQTFKTVCINGTSPTALGAFSDPNGYWHDKDYDMTYRGGEKCEIEFGTTTPYDQVFHAFQEEIPEGGYKITPVAQGGEGQLAGRNYYIMSRP